MNSLKQKLTDSYKKSVKPPASKTVTAKLTLKSLTNRLIQNLGNGQFAWSSRNEAVQLRKVVTPLLNIF